MCCLRDRMAERRVKATVDKNGWVTCFKVVRVCVDRRYRPEVACMAPPFKRGKNTIPDEQQILPRYSYMRPHGFHTFLHYKDARYAKGRSRTLRIVRVRAHMSNFMRAGCSWERCPGTEPSLIQVVFSSITIPTFKEYKPTPKENPPGVWTE